MRDLWQFARGLRGAYHGHHQDNPKLLEAIGVFGVLAFSALYLVRLTGKLPPRWDDLYFRFAAIAMCLLLALRQRWPQAMARWYLPYSYVAIFYCLAFFLPLTLLQNGGAVNTIVNMVIGAVLIILLTDWRNTLVMLLTGYAASATFYWAVNPRPKFPVEFLFWWAPMCIVLVAGGSISKYVERRAELMRLRRLYDGLAGSIAHEMRTPLADVSQVLDTIATLVPPGSDAAVAIGHGRRAVRRGLQAISLTLHQLKNQSSDAIQLQPLSAAHCVSNAVAEYAYEDAVQRDRVSVQVEQDFVFYGDETAIRLVLFNLLKNALYYTSVSPDMRLTLRIETNPLNRIVVYDTGPGIALELQARLFEEFQTMGKDEGTGLGLAFCRRVMRGFGGDIECASEIGRYTQFTLTFPPVDAAAVPLAQAQAQAAAARGDSVLPADLSLSGRRVLVVDDSTLNRKIARARLTGLGAHVAEAQHAAEALRMVREGAHADAILMDMNMPGMSGIDATRALRALRGPAARIPVVLLTADPTPSARQTAFAAGVDGFLVKPLEPDLLLDELLRLIGPSQTSAFSHSLPV